MLDQMIADSLGMGVEDYVNKIEKLSVKRMEILISVVLDGDINKVKRVRQILSNIK